jgi:hypothetical protein
VRLTVTTSNAVIKIEPNTALRGSVYTPEHRILTPAAQRQFFVGMTQDDIPLDDLLVVQQELPGKLADSLDRDERAFLLSLKRGQSEQGRLGLDHLEQLPALQWKLRNIQRIPPDKHREAVARLEEILNT